MSARESDQVDALYKKFQTRTSKGINSSINNEAESVAHYYSSQLARLPVPEDEEIYLADPSAYPWIVKKTVTYSQNPVQRVYTDEGVKNIIPFYNSPRVFGVTVGGAALAPSQYTLDYDRGTMVLYFDPGVPPTITFCQYVGSYYSASQLVADGSSGVTVRVDTSGNTFVGGDLNVGSNVGGGGNTIRFYGVAGDLGPNYTHTVMKERLFNGSDNSELLIYKGNDTGGSGGPDRIRLKAPQIRLQTYATALVDNSGYELDGSDGLIVLNPNGNVGIGTSTPTALVDMTMTANDRTAELAMRRATETSGAGSNPGGGVTTNLTLGRITFFGKDVCGGYSLAPSASISAHAESTFDNLDASGFPQYSGHIRFNTRPLRGGDVVERMRIDGSGNVGIGKVADNTPTRNYNLDVSGVIAASHSVVAKMNGLVELGRGRLFCTVSKYLFSDATYIETAYFDLAPTATFESSNGAKILATRFFFTPSPICRNLVFKTEWSGIDQGSAAVWMCIMFSKKSHTPLVGSLGPRGFENMSLITNGSPTTQTDTFIYRTIGNNDSPNTLLKTNYDSSHYGGVYEVIYYHFMDGLSYSVAKMNLLVDGSTYPTSFSNTYFLQHHICASSFALSEASSSRLGLFGTSGRFPIAL